MKVTKFLQKYCIYFLFVFKASKIMKIRQYSIKLRLFSFVSDSFFLGNYSQKKEKKYFLNYLKSNKSEY